MVRDDQLATRCDSTFMICYMPSGAPRSKTSIRHCCRIDTASVGLAVEVWQYARYNVVRGMPLLIEGLSYFGRQKENEKKLLFPYVPVFFFFLFN